MRVSVPIFEAGCERRVVLPVTIVDEARQLAEAHDQFFTRGESCEVVPISALVWSRLRLPAVLSATSLMCRCAEGTQERRAPISLQELDDGHFLVLDGNFTAAVCLAVGWRTIPAHRVDPEPSPGSP